MNELPYRATYLNLHSYRHMPAGYEDKWTREYEKEKIEVVERGSQKLGIGGGATRGSSSKEDTKATGSKSYKYFRFVRKKDGSIDTSGLVDELPRTMERRLKDIVSATSLGGRGSDFTQGKLDFFAFTIDEVEEVGKTSEIPTYVPQPLNGAFGGMQDTYFEKLDRLVVRGTLRGPAPKEALQKAIEVLGGPKFGPTKRGTLVIEEA